MILLTDSEGPDQTARMRRLIWAFAVCIYPKAYLWNSKRLSRFLEQKRVWIKGYAHVQIKTAKCHKHQAVSRKKKKTKKKNKKKTVAFQMLVVRFCLEIFFSEVK